MQLERLPVQLPQDHLLDGGRFACVARSDVGDDG
jgi:hypothetical protein